MKQKKLISWLLSAAIVFTSFAEHGLIETSALHLASPSEPDIYHIHDATGSTPIPDIDLSDTTPSEPLPEATDSTPDKIICEFCDSILSEGHKDNCLSFCSCDEFDEFHEYGCALYKIPDIPKCSCGILNNLLKRLEDHDDDCSLKEFCDQILLYTEMEELAGFWNKLPAKAKEYLIENLSVYEQELLRSYGVELTLKKSSVLPACSCQTSGNISSHADNCSLKRFYKEQYHSLSAKELYHLWSDSPDDVKDFLLNIVSWEDQVKRSELIKYIDGYEQVLQFGNLTLEGTLPEGATLIVNTIDEEKELLLHEENQKETIHKQWSLYLDIGIEIDGDAWQPENDNEITVTLKNLPKIEGETVELRHYLDTEDAIQNAYDNDSIYYLDVEGNEHLFEKELAAAENSLGIDGTICYTMPEFQAETDNNGSELTFSLDSFSVVELDVYHQTPTDHTEAAPVSVSEEYNDVSLFASNEYISNEYLETKKSVTYDPENDQFILRLESWLTGKPTIIDDERIPSDVVLLIDQSGSMEYCFGCGSSTKTNISSGYLNATADSYYVKGIDQSTVIKIYFCDASVNGCSHSTDGWYDVDHSVTKDEGNLFALSIANSKNAIGKAQAYMRKPYKDSALKTAASTELGYYKSTGEYYRKSSSVYYRQYYCSDCCCWFDKPDHSTHYYTTTEDKANGIITNAGSSYPRVPDRKSGDNSNFANVFYHLSLHTVNKNEAATLDKTKTFYLRTLNLTRGDVHPAVNYCEDCDGWHKTDDTEHETTYLPTSTQFYAYCLEISPRRYEALDVALKGFLENIYEDSIGNDGVAGTDDDVNNRLAIVGFSSGTGNELMSYSNKSGIATPVTYTDLTASAGSTYYENAFQNANEQDGQDIIDHAVSQLTRTGNTEMHIGMEIVSEIFKANPIQDGEKRKRIVVAFTDGVPNGKNSSGSYVNFECSGELLSASISIKNEAEATIYTVGIFSGADASSMLTHCASTSTTESIRSNKIMHLVSSNFLNADTLGIAYTADDVNPDLDYENGESYFLSAGTTGALNDIFNAISSEIKQTGGAHIPTLGSSSYVKDVVTDDFVISGDISAHTESYTGTVNGKETWNYDEDDEIVESLVSNKIGNTVTLNFNFAKYYVATDYNGEEAIHKGRKLVIEIPIKRADGSPGGEKIPTNVPGESGIFDGSGTVYEAFALPHVDLPNEELNTTTVTVKKVVEGAIIPATFDFEFTGHEIVTKEIMYRDTEETEDGNGNYLKAESVLADPVEIRFSNQTTEKITDVLIGCTLTISEKETDGYDVDVSIDGGSTWFRPTVDQDGTITFQTTVTEGLEILVRNAVKRGSLTIVKSIEDTYLPYGTSETFLYEILCNANDGNTYSYFRSLTIQEGKKSTSVTLENIPNGTYLIRELSNSRYKFNSVTGDGSIVSGKTGYIWTTILYGSPANEEELGYKVFEHATVTFKNDLSHFEKLSHNEIEVNRLIYGINSKQ